MEITMNFFNRSCVKFEVYLPNLWRKQDHISLAESSKITALNLFTTILIETVTILTVLGSGGPLENIRLMIGTKKEAVFPEPVCAHAIRSLFPTTIGIEYFCTGVGLV